MKHTAHRAIRVRLTMWKTFFETLQDTTPDGATNEEYGLDQLVELARETDAPDLHELADVVEQMGADYLLCDDNEYAAILMDDGVINQDTRNGKF